MNKPKQPMRKTCSRGHAFYKSSDCPTCPTCWPGQMKKLQSDFPKAGAPALRALRNAGIKTLAGLTKHTREEVLDLHGMGPKAMAILQTAMKKRKLKFKS